MIFSGQAWWSPKDVRLPPEKVASVVRSGSVEDDCHTLSTGVANRGEHAAMMQEERTRLSGHPAYPAPWGSQHADPMPRPGRETAVALREVAKLFEDWRTRLSAAMQERCRHDAAHMPW